MRFFSFACLSSLVLAKESPKSSYINGRKDACYEWEVEYHGGGLDNPMLTGVTSPYECQEQCKSREGCNYFTWVNSQHDVVNYRNTCWLKSTQGNPQSCETCVSGPRECGGSEPTTDAPSGCCQALVISTTGDANDYQWTRFGRYTYHDASDDGRPIYRQDNEDNYLYYLDWLGVWYVNDNPMENMGGLINWDDSWCPSDIGQDWSFYRWGDGEINDWEADPAIKITCDNNSNPRPTTTTTTSTTTTTTHPTHPDSEPCTWGSYCDGCSVWSEMDGTRYCCSNNCNWGDVFVWSENGQVHCECVH